MDNAVATSFNDPEFIDALTELMNIGVGRAAAMLSDLIGMRIDLSVPSIRLCSANTLAPISQPPLNSEQVTVIVQSFAGAISGRAALVFTRRNGLALAKLLTGQEAGEELDAELSSVLLEVGNIVLNGILGSLSNMARANLTYSVPEIASMDQLHLDVQTPVDRSKMLAGDVNFWVEARMIDGSVAILFELDSIATLLRAVQVAT